MTDSTESKVGSPAAAHKLVLMAMLKSKTYGSRITAAEICECTGADDWRRFGYIIRRWADESGLPLHAVPDDGWRVAQEHEVVDSATADRRSARRKEHRGLRKLIRAPSERLSDVEQRRLEFETKRAAVRVAKADDDDAAIKKEFRLTERVPLRRLVDGKAAQ